MGISTTYSYEREPEPAVITDDVTNTQIPERYQPSSDTKMNNSQNRYIWIKTNEGGPHEVTWEVNFEINDHIKKAKSTINIVSGIVSRNQLMSHISELIGKGQEVWSDKVRESTINADHTSDLSHVHQ